MKTDAVLFLILAGTLAYRSFDFVAFAFKLDQSIIRFDRLLGPSSRREFARVRIFVIRCILSDINDEPRQLLTFASRMDWIAVHLVRIGMTALLAIFASFGLVAISERGSGFRDAGLINTFVTMGIAISISVFGMLVERLRLLTEILSASRL